MKKVISLIVIFIMAVCLSVTVSAAGIVTYDGDADKFIFEPGSDHSPTDLFSDFKDVMPGDSVTQKITVKNDTSNNVKVKIYIRSLGAHADSADFLSKLELKVKVSDTNDMGYMFDAAADESAGLTDRVCLGTLFSGGKVDLDVTLTVPVELGNEYSDSVGYLDWEFMIEEFPTEQSDPTPPDTGDNNNIAVWFAVLICSAVLMLILIIISKRIKNDESKQAHS